MTLGKVTDHSGDPPRVWETDSHLPGCAFTRSIGDSVAEAIGVTAEAEISTHIIEADDRFLVIASDGVWEFLTNEAVVNLVCSFENPLTACRTLVAESYRLWMQFDVRSDDITAFIAYFDRG